MLDFSDEERVTLSECLKLKASDQGYVMLKENASLEMQQKMRDILERYRITKKTIPRSTNRSRSQKFRHATKEASNIASVFSILLLL